MTNRTEVYKNTVIGLVSMMYGAAPDAAELFINLEG